MGRGKRGGFDALVLLPWPVGLVIGVLGYVVVRHGVPAWMAGHGGPLGEAFASQPDMLAIPAWLVLALCTLAAAVSFVGARRKRRLLDTRTDLDSIAALGWRDFERLVGEAFRRRGYVIEETGLGGADGGIDLILCRNGQRILVQCKRWRHARVPVSAVREMYGLLTHHRADAVRIAALGGFTRDAARFAEGKPVELIDGPTVLEMIREVQADTSQARASLARIQPASSTADSDAEFSPPCPRCNARMVKRTNRRDGRPFWGCSRYPACRGTR